MTLWGECLNIFGIWRDTMNLYPNSFTPNEWEERGCCGRVPHQILKWEAPMLNSGFFIKELSRLFGLPTICCFWPLKGWEQLPFQDSREHLRTETPPFFFIIIIYHSHPLAWHNFCQRNLSTNCQHSLPMPSLSPSSSLPMHWSMTKLAWRISCSGQANFT